MDLVKGWNDCSTIFREGLYLVKGIFIFAKYWGIEEKKLNVWEGDLTISLFEAPRG